MSCCLKRAFYFYSVYSFIFVVLNYFLFGFFGNHPFSTLFSCSYNSWILQKQEMPKMATLPEKKREWRKMLATQANRPIMKKSQAIFLLK